MKDTDEKLQLARGAVPQGSVGELHLKHLLVLNARHSAATSSFIPRAYYFPDEDVGQSFGSEAKAFKYDYQLCHAILVLRKVVEEQLQVKEAAAAAALAVVGRHVDEPRTAVDTGISQEEWQAMLETCEENTTISELTFKKCSKALQAVEGDASLQLGLLAENLWVSKPSTGCLGKGIAFVQGIDTAGLQIRTSSAAKDTRHSDTLGCIIQKYIEHPHLVFPSTSLMDLHLCDKAEEWLRAAVAAGQPDGAFKYNLRLWLSICWSADSPEAWLYDEGYLDFASRPYSRSLNEATAHISNLSDIAGGASRPWMWSTRTYRQVLACGVGHDVFGEAIKPQLRHALTTVLSTVRPSNPDRSSMDSTDSARGLAGKRRWKRFGVDFLIDRDYCPWLIEFNHNPGMSASKGQRGAMKRQLVQQFCMDEKNLHAVRSLGEELQGEQKALHNFQRLLLPTWAEHGSQEHDIVHMQI